MSYTSVGFIRSNFLTSKSDAQSYRLACVQRRQMNHACTRTRTQVYSDAWIGMGETITSQTKLRASPSPGRIIKERVRIGGYMFISVCVLYSFEYTYMYEKRFRPYMYKIPTIHYRVNICRTHIQRSPSDHAHVPKVFKLKWLLIACVVCRRTCVCVSRYVGVPPHYLLGETFRYAFDYLAVCQCLSSRLFN